MKNLAFSSLATVYGLTNLIPIKEGVPKSTTNHYGATKLMIEQILEEIALADSTWQISLFTLLQSDWKRS